MNRRVFMTVAAAGAARLADGFADDVPDAIKRLRPMTDGIRPITAEERRGRIEKAQRLMRENKIGAIVLEGGSSMFYFTGTRWNAGERTFALVIPAKGELAWVVESDEKRAIHHELISTGSDVRVAQDNADSFKKLAQVLKERGATRVGIEERVRFAVYDGIRKEGPSLEFTSAVPVSEGCRVIKTPAEIALLPCGNAVYLPKIAIAPPLVPSALNAAEILIANSPFVMPSRSVVNAAR